VGVREAKIGGESKPANSSSSSRSYRKDSRQKNLALLSLSNPRHGLTLRYTATSESNPVSMGTP
jgi:hypothetical protein